MNAFFDALFSWLENSEVQFVNLYYLSQFEVPLFTHFIFKNNSIMEATDLNHCSTLSQIMI